MARNRRQVNVVISFSREKVTKVFSVRRRLDLGLRVFGKCCTEIEPRNFALGLLLAQEKLVFTVLKVE